MYKIVFGCLLIAGLSGCSSVSGIEEGKLSYANEVMDKDNLIFDEIVVGSYYSSDTETTIINTHITLAAILNSSSQEASSFYSESDARRIVQSTFPRISAKVLDYVQGSGDARSRLDIRSVRNQLPRIASEVFLPIFSKWKEADKYNVEFIVMSIYFTDGSVSKTTSHRNMWW